MNVAGSESTRVLIVAHFTGDGPTGNNRFHELARRLARRCCDVELVTSDFSHRTKSLRSPEESVPGYRLTHIAEPPYKKNISLQRFRSHRVFARNVERYLRDREAVDVVYCPVPSLAVAEVAASFAHRSGAKFIVDIQDLWPEAFGMVLPDSMLRLGSRPLLRQADRVYGAAHALVAVSRTYLERGLQANPDCSRTAVVFLGTDLQGFDDAARLNGPVGQPANSEMRNELVVGYVGSLSSSYDLTTVISGINKASQRCAVPMRLLVMGDGPRRSEFCSQALALGVDVEWLGRLPYPEMAGLLHSCDVAVNPIAKGSAASVINKVCDYAAAGLPVLNFQDSAEYRHLVESYGAGINTGNGDADEFASALVRIAEDPSLRISMGAGNRRMAEELFDRSATYERLAEFLLALPDEL